METMRKSKRNQEVNRPRPFGVDYVPRPRRAQPRLGKLFVGRASEIPPGSSRAVDTDQFRIAVFNVEGKFYAIKDACPHAEYPLSKGIVEGGQVTCASHSWKFDIKTGECLRGESGVFIRTFSVVVENNEIWVDLS